MLWMSFPLWDFRTPSQSTKKNGHKQAIKQEEEKYDKQTNKKMDR